MVHSNREKGYLVIQNGILEKYHGLNLLLSINFFSSPHYAKSINCLTLQLSLSNK